MTDLICVFGLNMVTSLIPNASQSTLKERYQSELAFIDTCMSYKIHTEFNMVTLTPSFPSRVAS